MYYNQVVYMFSFQVILGPSTKITREQYESVAWADAWAATRDIATIIFGRKVLATHTLSGLMCNTKRNEKDGYAVKPRLPANKVVDIIGKRYYEYS
jgi:hypothetical protein